MHRGRMALRPRPEQPYAWAIAEGVLITGVYGSGKSSVAAEIAYLLQERRQPYALLDLDFWAGPGVTLTTTRPGSG
jgi:hypothetical protein